MGVHEYHCGSIFGQTIVSQRSPIAAIADVVLFSEQEKRRSEIPSKLKVDVHVTCGITSEKKNNKQNKTSF